MQSRSVLMLSGNAEDHSPLSRATTTTRPRAFLSSPLVRLSLTFCIKMAYSAELKRDLSSARARATSACASTAARPRSTTRAFARASLLVEMASAGDGRQSISSATSPSFPLTVEFGQLDLAESRERRRGSRGPSRVHSSSEGVDGHRWCFPWCRGSWSTPSGRLRPTPTSAGPPTRRRSSGRTTPRIPNEGPNGLTTDHNKDVKEHQEQHQHCHGAAAAGGRHPSPPRRGQRDCGSFGPPAAPSARCSDPAATSGS